MKLVFISLLPHRFWSFVSFGMTQTNDELKRATISPWTNTFNERTTCPAHVRVGEQWMPFDNMKWMSMDVRGTYATRSILHVNSVVQVNVLFAQNDRVRVRILVHDGTNSAGGAQPNKTWRQCVVITTTGNCNRIEKMAEIFPKAKITIQFVRWRVGWYSIAVDTADDSTVQINCTNCVLDGLYNGRFDCN